MKTCDDCGAVIVGRTKKARLCSTCQAEHYRLYQGIHPRRKVLCRVCGRAFTQIEETQLECPGCRVFTPVKLRAR